MSSTPRSTQHGVPAGQAVSRVTITIPPRMSGRVSARSSDESLTKRIPAGQPIGESAKSGAPSAQSERTGRDRGCDEADSLAAQARDQVDGGGQDNGAEQ